MSSKMNYQFAAITFSGSGDNAVITGLASQGTGMTPPSFKIWALGLVLGGTTNITFKDGTTAITGAMPMLANGSFLLAPATDAWFVLSPGKNFTINSSASVQVSGWVAYSL